MGKKVKPVAEVRGSKVIDIARTRSARSKITNMVELGVLTPDELCERKIVHPSMKNRDVLNTFRDIKVQLIKKSFGSNFVVSILSVEKQSGSTLIATNLGAVLALDKTKTALLVDCNLYNPGMGRLLDVAPDYGLTDYLTEDSLDINDVIYATGIPRLRVIPVGTQLDSGAEFLVSERMERFVKDLKQRYPDRYIILDMPPISDWPGSESLAKLSDFSVLVVPYGKVTERKVTDAINLIGKEKLAGMIFNH